MHYKLVIGCGGAGLTTMAALCKRIAYCRDCDLSGYWFLAVDSDEGALSNFGRMGLLQGGRFACHTRMFMLGQGCLGFEDIAVPYLEVPFVNGNNVEGHERIKKHWWHDGDGRPYRGRRLPFANHVSAIECYGIAWAELARLENVIQELIESMVRAGDGRLSVDVCIISSLAGETGRGCWGLIALKVREILERRFGIRAHTLGVFYDATVFSSCYRINFEFALRCKVNALTGLSELSCWLGNETRKIPISFRLPSLKMPEREDCDVIVVPCDKDKSNGPIDELRLIDGINSRCQSPQRCFNETADALFLEMSSVKLASRRVNDFTSMGSSGSATFEVDIEKIDEYCMDEACRTALKKMSEGGGGVSPSVARFFDTIPLNKKISSIVDIRPDNGGNVFQRLSSLLMKRNAERFDDFARCLPMMKPDEARMKLRFVVEKMSACDVEDSMTEVLSTLGLDGGAEKVEDFIGSCVMEVLQESGGHVPMFGRLRDFLLQLRNDILAARDIPRAIDPPMSAAVAIQEFGKRTVLEVLLGKPRFNADETRILLDRVGGHFSGVVADQFLVENYEEMYRVVGDLTDRVLKKVESLIVRVDKIVNSCRKVHGASSHGDSSKDEFKTVFVTPDRSLEAIVDNECMNARCRILKPVVESRESLSSLVESALSIADGLQAFGERMLREMPGKGELLERELARQIGEDVRLADGFLENNFSFVNVLARNREYWNDELKQLKGNPDREGWASDFFRRTLGTELVVDWDGSRKLPPVDVLKYTIVDTFAYRTNPCCDLDERCVADRILTVWAPFDITEEQRNLYEHRSTVNVRSAASFALIDVTDPASSLYAYFSHVDVKIVAPNRYSGRSGVNEDAHNHCSRRAPADQLVMRPWHQFDAYQALKYYMERDVHDKLEEAERKDGKSIFCKYASARIGPLGYLSPIYVRDVEWSSRRWKPWMSYKEGDD